MPDLAAGVADRLAGVARLERAPAPRRARRARRRAGAAACARSAGRDRPPGREGRLRRARPRRRSPRRRRAGPRPAPRSVAGSMTSIMRATSPGSRAPRPAPRSPRLSPSSSGCHRTPSAKRVAGHLDRLDHVVVGRPAADDQPLAEPVDALVVVRLAPRRARAPTARAASEPGSSRTSWSPKAPGRVAVVARARRVGQVLVERAAAGDVQQLHAAADRRAPACRARAPGGASASSNASRSGRVPVRLRVGLGAVGGRIDVGAAGEQQPVDAGRAAASGSRRAASSGGSSSGEAAGRLDRRAVGARRDVDVDVRPRPPSAARSIAAQIPIDRTRPRSQPLEAPEPLPVGDRGLERVELDPGAVEVVVDHLLRRTPRARPRWPANRSRASYMLVGTRGLSDS